MDERKATAHQAGAVYFVFMIVAIIGEFFIPPFLVPGDAAATARAIATGQFTYRMDVVLGFVTLVLFLFLVALLYQLFREVHPGYARTMVLLVGVGIAVALANMMVRLIPLVLLRNADELAAFTQPQRDALALGALRWHMAGSAIATTFWGLWLFPFGILVIRSGFLPRILGYALIVAGIAYVVTSTTALVLPDYRHAVTRAMMPLYFGEVPIIFWLLFRGVRVRQVGVPVACVS